MLPQLSYPKFPLVLFEELVTIFFGRRQLAFAWSPLLSLTCGPAENRTATGSLPATSRTPPCQLLYSTGTPVWGARHKQYHNQLLSYCHLKACPIKLPLISKLLRNEIHCLLPLPESAVVPNSLVWIPSSHWSQACAVVELAFFTCLYIALKVHSHLSIWRHQAPELENQCCLSFGVPFVSNGTADFCFARNSCKIIIATHLQKLDGHCSVIAKEQPGVTTNCLAATHDGSGPKQKPWSSKPFYEELWQLFYMS